MKGYEPIVEIARCIELQFEPETRTWLIAAGGCWTNPRTGKVPYHEWLNKMLKEAEDFCKKEGLI